MIQAIKIFLPAVCLLLLPLDSYAAWITTSGKVIRISTYSSTNTVLVQLDVNGTSVSECSNNITFAISKDMSEEARSRMYSLLLAAKVAGDTVSIAYSDTGSCEPWDASTSAYRRILRITG